VATQGVVVDSQDQCGGANVVVAAGEDWDGFVAQAVDAGWSGVEALSGIPGSTGATPVQNVGAYGQEVAQTIARVRVWDRREERVRTMTSIDCGFSYRHSVFKASDRYVVIDVMFQLVPATLSRPVRYADLATQLGVEVGERVPLAEAREAVLAQRRRRGMVLDADDHDTWSCGSFFTNPILSAAEFEALEARVADRLGASAGAPPRFPEAGGSVKTSAAWLIERAGFGKGFGLPGPAALSTKHTLAVTNRGGATASDVAALARRVRDGVRDAFGITLVNEPVFVGHEL
jgi:UDP-N-acetylmuramate dehydrogenase